MNEDEDEPVGIYSSRQPGSFTDFVQQATAPKSPQIKMSASPAIHLQRQQENVAQFDAFQRQRKRRNLSGDLIQLDPNSDLYSHSPKIKKRLSTIFEQQSQIFFSGLQNQNERSLNSVNLTSLMHSRGSNNNRPLLLEEIQMQQVENSKNSSDQPTEEQKSTKSVQDVQNEKQIQDIGYHAWVDKTFKYSCNSRRALLESLNIKVHIRMNKVFLCLIFIVICLEQFIRTLATELSDPQSVKQYYTLAQQAICAVALVLVQIFQPSVSKNSHFVVYFLELLIILLQPSFSPQTQQNLGSNLMIQGFLVTSYINMFSSFAELTFLSMFFVVLNYRLRVQLYKQPHLQKCVKELLASSTTTSFSQVSQNGLINCYQQAHWHDSLIYGTILFVVLCLHAHYFFRVEALQAQTGQPRQTNSEFDNPNVGVYNCQTIQSGVNFQQQLLNSVDCSLAIVSFEKQTAQDYQNQMKIIFANQSFKSLLSGIDKDLEIATQKMAFQKCSFKQLSENFNLQGGEEENTNRINESLTLDSIRNEDGPQTSSLSEIVFQLSKKVSIKETTVYVKLLLQLKPKSDTFDQSELDNFDQQALLMKQHLQKSNHRKRQSYQRGKKLKNQWHDNERVDTDDCLSFCKGYMVFELKVRLVLQQKKLFFSVQMTPINSTIKKVLNQAKVDLESLPKVFTNEQQLLQLKQVIKYSQLVEQQISEFSGVPSRTSIIVKTHSSYSLPDQIENIDAKVKTDKNQTNTVFARYQYYLSSVWCNAVHVAYHQKSQLNAWHVQNKGILLNFKKVSKQTQSIENHVKEFLIQFGQQIEFKNLHVSVGQGQMPMEPLFTDWKLYDQILFQIVSNSVKFNKVDGAIAVSIYFQKEVKDAVKNDYLMGNAMSPSSFEVGRIVTVVKDTGIGMSSLQQRELFRIKTLSENKTKANFKGHHLQPKIAGVGLTTADVLVKCLGGSISVISKEQCGSQVTFDVQVTTYPLNNRVPSYRYSDKGQTLTFPLMLKTLNQEPYVKSSYQNSRRVSEDQNLKNPLQVDRSQRESMSVSDSFNNEEEQQMFEKVFEHFDKIENNSDGQLYQPKPPKTSFFNQDYYLDDSFLQRQNLNEKSSKSVSQHSQLLQKEEVNQQNQIQQHKLVYDVISNKSSQMQVEDAQMKMDNSRSQEPNHQIQSLIQQTITSNRILSFADMIRSSISKRSPLTAMVHSNPSSIEYQKISTTRKFNSSENKKFQQNKSHLDIAFLKQSRRAKVPEYALSCDNITMKAAVVSSQEIQIKSKEAKQLSDDRNILIERDIRRKKKTSSEYAVKEEEDKQQLESLRESEKVDISHRQKSLNFPLVFSSGVSSIKNNQSIQADNEKFNKMGDAHKSKHQNIDFTFQKGKSREFASNSVEIMGRSNNSLSLPGGIQSEESSQILKSYSLDQQVQISVEMDQNSKRMLIQQLSNVGGLDKNLLSRPLDDQAADAVQVQEINSDNQFSDLSIGESEHCFRKLQAKGIVVLNESEKMSRLDEPPLQDRLKTLSGVLVNKGFLLFDGQNNVKSSDMQFQQDQQLSHKVYEPNSKNQQSSLRSSEDKVQLLRFYKNQTDSEDSLEINQSNRLNQRKNLAKNVDEKMKSQFCALPSVKNMLESKRQLKRGASSSSNSRMCKCKLVLVITDDTQTQSLIRNTILNLDANGVDTAQDCQEAIKVLSLKLTAMCCNDSYGLIFVTLEREFLHQNIVKRILETIDLWNEKMRSKGRQPIEIPQIVGITNQPLTKSQKQGIDTILTQPITDKQISDIFMTVGSQLL